MKLQTFRPGSDDCFPISLPDYIYTVSLTQLKVAVHNLRAILKHHLTCNWTSVLCWLYCTRFAFSGKGTELSRDTSIYNSDSVAFMVFRHEPIKLIKKSGHERWFLVAVTFISQGFYLSEPKNSQGLVWWAMNKKSEPVVSLVGMKKMV